MLGDKPYCPTINLRILFNTNSQWPISPTNLSFEKTEIWLLRSDICLQRIISVVGSTAIFFAVQKMFCYHLRKNKTEICLFSPYPRVTFNCFKCNTRLYVLIPGHMTAFVHYYWRLTQSRLTSLICLSKIVLSFSRLSRFFKTAMSFQDCLVFSRLHLSARLEFF
jgi:hypothetical protein